MHSQKQTDHVLSTSLQATFLTSQMGKHPAVSPGLTVVSPIQAPTVKSILQLLSLERLKKRKELITSRYLRIRVMEM